MSLIEAGAISGKIGKQILPDLLVVRAATLNPRSQFLPDLLVVCCCSEELGPPSSARRQMLLAVPPSPALLAARRWQAASGIPGMPELCIALGGDTS